MRVLIFLFTLSLFISCVKKTSLSYTVESVSVDDEKNNWFMPQEKGWLAGDAAHSIQLDKNRILWIFGDTWPGSFTDEVLIPDLLYVHNSIAIQYIATDGESKFEFIFGDVEEGRSFFPQKSEMPGEYLWPTNGIILNNALYIFCQAVSHDETGWFGISGTVIIKVKNKDQHPSKWEKEYFDFNTPAWTDKTPQVQYHSALFKEENFIYFMGFKAYPGEGKKEAILARTDTLKFLETMNSNDLEHLKRVGDREEEWVKNLAEAKTIFEPGNTESNIQFIKDWGLYVTTTYSAIDNKLLLTYSNALVGPWSEPEIIYENPNINCPDPRNKCIETYAVRCHPELSTSVGQIVISYITSYTGEYKDAPIESYRPRFIKLQLSRQ